MKPLILIPLFMIPLTCETFGSTIALKDGTEYVSPTVSTVRSYVETFREGDPATYARLDENLKIIEDRAVPKSVAPLGNLFGVVGFVMMTGGLLALEYSVALGGTGLVFVAAFLTSEPVLTSAELMQFVNDYNRARPKEPLEIVGT